MFLLCSCMFSPHHFLIFVLEVFLFPLALSDVSYHGPDSFVSHSFRTRPVTTSYYNIQDRFVVRD